MWQILGNLYKKDKEISKDYLEIKELIRKFLFKELQKVSLSTVITSLQLGNQEKKIRPYKDCNLATVLKAIEEVCIEENVDNKALNVYIDEIIISVDTIPF